MSFYETPRFPESIQYGTVGGPLYATDVVMTSAGNESRNQKWTQARYRFNANLIKTQADFETLIAFFHVMAGRLHGFRFKDWADYKSSGVETALANTDQVIGSGDGVDTTFQLVKNYAAGANTRARTITKPVSGTTVVAIAAVGSQRWTVDTTTGVVSFSADVNDSIIAASNAANAVLTLSGGAHGLVIGDSVYIENMTGGTWAGVTGRYTISNVAVADITIDLDSTGLGAYAGGGNTHSLPQTGESVTAGYEFDVPVRFDIDELPTSWETCLIGALDVPLVELRI